MRNCAYVEKELVSVVTYQKDFMWMPTCKCDPDLIHYISVSIRVTAHRVPSHRGNVSENEAGMRYSVVYFRKNRIARLGEIDSIGGEADAVDRYVANGGGDYFVKPILVLWRKTHCHKYLRPEVKSPEGLQVSIWMQLKFLEA